MQEKTQQGYLVLADISGYTSYLAGVELLHAHDILADLLELIVERFKPLLKVTKFEGDAVFAHVPKAEIPRDETLLEIIESTYLGFRDRRETIRRRTTCQCNACRAIPSLDLKFIVHFGEYLLQSVSGAPELVGSDVNLAHRLLKNHVSEATGWKAYILFTGPALADMDVNLEDLQEGTETYEHLGEVKTFSLDLHARYQELIEARREYVSAEEADLVVSYQVPAPALAVWDWMNDIQKRLRWESFDDIRPISRPGGRTGAGARNHCAHGRNLVIETILDWHPFEYYTVEYPMAIQTRRLEPEADGTRLDIYFKLKMPFPSWMKRLVANSMFKMTRSEQQFETMLDLIKEEEEEDDPAK